ncbi:AraC family transcriptional regulator [Marinobacter salinexigens]|uniref:AraC family transcriptional regulator n=1 Tax=Marinobacter salinexigens TaxID=2919747 RepID=A0A5B0VGX6_9GAMM|nr:GyrI-like domain-containing protein [Marinobacter salinexigens]KAA1173832.1 AraC family transcriptional regulator [Marinobacter salinexigens]
MNKTYKTRIDTVIQYIESNLNSRITLADVAEVSHFSPYHFHRIFTGIMGETVNDFIARRRLERAVNQLVFNPDMPVTQVALDLGFSSSANFSKAVKLHFGYSPSELRNPDKVKDSKIGKLFSKYGKEFQPSDLYPSSITNDVMNRKTFKDTNMKIEVRELERKRVCTLASERGYEPEGIYAAWDKLISWASNHGIMPGNQQRFALAFDNPAVTPIDKCRYTAAIVIGEETLVNAPFELSEIPNGKYAVLYYKGPVEETLNAQLSIYSDWLPDSGFEPDNYPMMERYLNDARSDGFVEMEIYVKLKEI